MLRAVIGVGVISFVMTATAYAQTCMGGPDLRDYGFQLGTGAVLHPDQQGTGIALTGGGPGGYGSFSTNFGFNEFFKSYAFAGTGAGSIDAGLVSVCPGGAGGYTRAFGEDGYLWNAGPTVNVGVRALELDQLRLVPTVGYSWQYVDGSAIFDNTYFSAVNVGVGMVFNRNVALVPGIGVLIPEFGETSTSFTLSAAFGF